MRIFARHFVALAAVCAGCATTAAQKPYPPIAYEDVKFTAEVPGNPRSSEVVVLWGEPRTGPSAMFLKIKKGPLPLHAHASDYHLLIVKGIAKHWSANERPEDAKPIGPGGYWFQPAKEAHADECLTDECIAYLVWGGKRDGWLVEPRKN